MTDHRFSFYLILFLLGATPSTGDSVSDLQTSPSPSQSTNTDVTIRSSEITSVALGSWTLQWKIAGTLVSHVSVEVPERKIVITYPSSVYKNRVSVISTFPIPGNYHKIDSSIKIHRLQLLDNVKVEAVLNNETIKSTFLSVKRCSESHNGMEPSKMCDYNCITTFQCPDSLSSVSGICKADATWDVIEVCHAPFQGRELEIMNNAHSPRPGISLAALLSICIGILLVEICCLVYWTVGIYRVYENLELSTVWKLLILLFAIMLLPIVLFNYYSYNKYVVGKRQKRVIVKSCFGKDWCWWFISWIIFPPLLLGQLMFRRWNAKIYKIYNVPEPRQKLFLSICITLGFPMLFYYYVDQSTYCKEENRKRLNLSDIRNNFDPMPPPPVSSIDRRLQGNDQDKRKSASTKTISKKNISDIPSESSLSFENDYVTPCSAEQGNKQEQNKSASTKRVSKVNDSKLTSGRSYSEENIYEIPCYKDEGNEQEHNKSTSTKRVSKENISKLAPERNLSYESVYLPPCSIEKENEQEQKKSASTKIVSRENVSKLAPEKSPLDENDYIMPCPEDEENEQEHDKSTSTKRVSKENVSKLAPEKSHLDENDYIMPCTEDKENEQERKKTVFTKKVSKENVSKLAPERSHFDENDYDMPCPEDEGNKQERKKTASTKTVSEENISEFTAGRSHFDENDYDMPCPEEKVNEQEQNKSASTKRVIKENISEFTAGGSRSKIKDIHRGEMNDDNYLNPMDFDAYYLPLDD